MNDEVKSAARVLDVLELFSLATEPLGVSEVAKRLGFPKSSSQGLLTTLVSRGYLNRGEQGFELPEELRGGWVGGLRVRLIRMAEPAMKRMADESGESAFIGVLLKDGSVQYLSKVASANEVRYDASLAPLRAAHATSIGLIILAHLPEHLLSPLLEPSRLHELTPSTVTDPGAIRKILATAKRNGFAEVQDANVEGASGVSAPIFGLNGEVVAALNLGAPSWRYKRARNRMTSIVRREAAVLSDYFRGVRTVVDAA